MARPKKPASESTGHTYSKAQLKERMEAEKKLKGSDDKIMDVPSIISMNKIAIEFYHIIIAMLHDTDILSNLDRHSIAILADNLAKLRDANQRMQDEGMTITQITKSGEKEVVNPIYQVWKDTQNNIAKLATQFGLTPSSRASLSDMALQQRKDDEDPLIQALSNIDSKREEA